MASITATPTPNARTRTGPGHLTRARAALAKVVAQGTQTASAARRRYRRPALVVASFASIDAAAWTTLGHGAGLLVLGILGLVFEALGGDE